jgi:hypothetical protein
MEDNTFTASSNTAWIQSYYGAATVLRFNTLTDVQYDNHGTGGARGGRWWEVYGNTLSSDGFNPNIRAGSGVMFNESSLNAGLCEEDSGYPAQDQIGRGQSQALYPAYAWLYTGSVQVDECEAPETEGMVQFNRDVYTDEDSASCTGGSTCTSGVGSGTTLPTSCTTGTAFWDTDAGGDWNTLSGGANDGALYKCTATDTWTLYYTPYTYPHPLQSGLEPDK